ncbi:MAG: transglycosylase domain-containing protein [Chloroflexota bacterium]
MPYRPKQRRLSRTASRSGSQGNHRPSFATRLAIARASKRKPASRGPSALLAVVLVLLVAGVTVASAGVIAAGGAAGVTIASLDEGLPDVRALRDLGFSQPTRIMDRKGKQELARFWEVRREVVDFEDIPPLVLDVTTAVEDDTFWDNPGFDLEATLNAFARTATGEASRGASTITQQLVRARLLPADVLAADNTSEGLYVRKAKELIQAFKLTQAFPGEEGKMDIITAYLNEIFYGQAYGIAAAADVYFAKELGELTIAEAALLAGIPQDPVKFDLFKHAEKERYGKKNKKTGRRKSRLVVPSCGADPSSGCVDSELVIRRDFILRRLRDGKGRWTRLSESQFQSALAEKIVVRRPKSVKFKAPHFVFALLPELNVILADREPIQRGGYTVITTLDMKAQRIGEKVIQAGAFVANVPTAKANQLINRLRLRKDRGWINKLRGANIRNGALVAQDYRTGDILAYVGSAGYYRKKSPRFDPIYDHAGQGRRQPGSAWKPIVYATGIDTGALTAGSVLLDINTPFGRGWTPKDADRRERGPILVRQALQQSYNIPAIRALHRTGIKEVRQRAVKAGMTFLNGNKKALDQAGLAGAIGTVEVKPVDMVATFGAFANGGKVTRPRYILKVIDSKGDVIYEAGRPNTKQVWKPSTAYIMADILSGNTNPAENTAWASVFATYNGPGGARRIMGVKTGTTNELKDYSTYGFLPQPKNKKQPALAVGVWFGNSDSSRPTVPSYAPIYSLDNAGRAWQAFIRDYMKGKPVPRFKRPKTGIVAATIDKFSGGAPGAWTRGTMTELFVRGTQPGAKREVDPPGLIYSRGCGALYVQPARAENPGAPASWIAAVNKWVARGAPGNLAGGAVAPGTDCNAPRSSSPSDKSGESGSDSDSRKRNGGGGNGGGNKPAPTCRPGSTTKPPGCTIAAPTE